MDNQKLENLIGTKDFYVKELEMLNELHKIYRYCFWLSAIGFVSGVFGLMISIV